jgi:hypothetical protein
MTHSFYRCQFEHGELKSVAKKKKLFHGIPRHVDFERSIATAQHSTFHIKSHAIAPNVSCDPQPKKTITYTCKKYLRGGVARIQ